jgi:hypothetical protein
MRSLPKWLLLLASLGLGVGLLAAPSDAHAQKAAKAAKKKKPADEKKAEAEGDAKAADAKKGEEPASENKAPGGDVKAAGTSATEAEKKKGEPDVVKVEESEKEEGVKTYTFSAIEVEGRLKSPQIIYFLRRVRAEFEAGLLGHRSFMPELSDTRRSPALR